jgi:hypothetical protein
MLRVLWLNWRDIEHPEAGGAEVFTHEVMLRLAKKGYHMTLFAERFPNILEVENIDGINVVRQGNSYTVYRKARKHCQEYMSKYDIVIDEINARPFLTPKFVKDKLILALIHHVSLEAWSIELPFPLGHIGYYFYHRRGLVYYENIPTATVSESSKKNLEKIGLKRVFVVPEDLTLLRYTKYHRRNLLILLLL